MTSPTGPDRDRLRASDAGQETCTPSDEVYDGEQSCAVHGGPWPCCPAPQQPPAGRSCGCSPGYRHQDGCTRGMAGLQLGEPEQLPAQERELSGPWPASGDTTVRARTAMTGPGQFAPVPAQEREVCGCGAGGSEPSSDHSSWCPLHREHGSREDITATINKAVRTLTDCGHSWFQHSREPGVGCLHVVLDLSTPGIVEHREFCPCTQPGTSEADQ